MADQESSYEAAARRLQNLGGHYAEHVDRIDTERNAPVVNTDTEKPPESSVGFVSNPIGLGATGTVGAIIGNKVGKAIGPYKMPEPPPNAARLALDELDKNRLNFTSGTIGYTEQADALKRQLDDLKQLHSIEKSGQDAARNAWIEAQALEKANLPTAPVAANQKIITPIDRHTRQIQGQGSEAGQINTGRANQSGYQATTQQIAEHGAEGQKVLGALQQSGVVKPHGVTVEFPGITYATPSGVLTPAAAKAQIEQMARQIIESNLPHDIKLAELRDLYDSTKRQTGQAYSKFSSAEAEMLKHMNQKNAILNPLERSVQLGEERLSGLGGVKAANAPSPLTWKHLAARVPGYLTGAMTGISALEAHQRAQEGDNIGAGIQGTGAALSAIGMIPHPVTKAIGLVGGLGADAALMGYDYFKPHKSVMEN